MMEVPAIESPEQLEKLLKDYCFDYFAWNKEEKQYTGEWDSDLAIEILSKALDQYAESYHAKKCAECWRVPRVMCSICGDPIIVGGVCENCVPDMFNGDRHFHSSDVGEFRKNLNSDIDEIIKNEPEAPHA